MRWVLAVVVLALLGTACSSGVPATTTPTTTAVPPVTASTSTQPSTTSTEAQTGVFVQLAFSASDFSECSEVVIVDRMVAEGDDPLTSSFELLVAGPTTNEQENGVWSWFSDETEGMVWSVTVEGDLLIVNFGDLRKIISNAGTSCGSEALLGQLNGTAFLSAEVERVTYEIEGSCDTFYNWLQRDCVIHIRP